MLTCSSCCVTVTFQILWHKNKLLHWKATPTRAFNKFLYEFLRILLISENSLKFANVFGEVTNSRSMMTVVVMVMWADHTKSTSDTFRLRHGDVVELMDELQQNALKDDWMYGRCERTGLCGGFPYDSIYILPTCEKPPPEFMVRSHSATHFEFLVGGVA